MADAVAKTATPDAAAGNPIDVTTVTTGAGTVDRQCVSIGDPTTGANRVAVSAAGKILVTPDSIALPANQSVNAAQLAGTATSVNSGVKDAGTLRVVLATDQPALTNKLLVTPDSVALPANQSVNFSQYGGTGVTLGQKVMASSQPVTLASDQTALATTPTPPTLTKGTQGATGYSVQALKDAGRSSVMFTGSFATTAVGETLMSFVTSSALAAVSGSVTSYTVTTGKRLRIQGIYATARSSTGTAARAVVTLRIRGAVTPPATAASPLQAVFVTSTPASTTATGFPGMGFIPDGFEIPSAEAVAFTITDPGWVTGTAVLTIDFTVVAFEF